MLNLLRHAIGKDCNENKFQVHSCLIRTFTQKYSPLPLSSFEEVNWDCLCPAELQLLGWLRFPQGKGLTFYSCFLNHFQNQTLKVLQFSAFFSQTDHPHIFLSLTFPCYCSKCSPSHGCRNKKGWWDLYVTYCHIHEWINRTYSHCY